MENESYSSTLLATNPTTNEEIIEKTITTTKIIDFISSSPPKTSKENFSQIIKQITADDLNDEDSSNITLEIVKRLDRLQVNKLIFMGFRVHQLEFLSKFSDQQWLDSQILQDEVGYNDFLWSGFVISSLGKIYTEDDLDVLFDHLLNAAKI